MELNENYQKSIDTLGDLYQLVDPSAHPLLGQLYFHVSRMYQFSSRPDMLISGYDKIENSLLEIVRTPVEEYFLQRNDISQLNFYLQLQGYDLQKWNTLLRILPLVLSASDIFAFSGSLDFVVDESGVHISGDVLSDQRIEQHRTFAYSLLRQFFENSSMLTYQISPSSDNSDKVRINLWADIGHDPRNAYVVESGGINRYVIGFSNIFKNYVLSPSQFRDLGKHPCFEVTEDLDLIRHERIPDRLRRDGQQKEVIHFNFLFRPVSLIIPYRGNILPRPQKNGLDNSRASLEGYEDTGRVNDRFKYIDIFSLLQG